MRREREREPRGNSTTTHEISLLQLLQHVRKRLLCRPSSSRLLGNSVSSSSGVSPAGNEEMGGTVGMRFSKFVSELFSEHLDGSLEVYIQALGKVGQMLLSTLCFDVPSGFSVRSSPSLASPFLERRVFLPHSPSRRCKRRFQEDPLSLAWIQ